MGHQGVTREFPFTEFRNEFPHPVKAQYEAEPFNISAYQFSSLEASVTRILENVLSESAVEQYQMSLNLVEELSYQFVCNAFFVDMDWCPVMGDVIRLNDFIRKHKLRFEYKRLIQTLLSRLEKGGFLKLIEEVNEPTWEVIQETPSKKSIRTAIKHLHTTLLKFKECEQEAKFSSYVGSHLLAVLRGRENGLSVLFPPEESADHAFGAKKLYENSRTMKYCKLNPTIDCVLSQTQFLINNGMNSASNPIRILEIGAGTGETTLPLLRTLSKHKLPIHYTLTDASNFFVGKTKELISDEFPKLNIDYKILDIERRPEEQGFDTGFYDIVITTDIFHTTEYLEDAVSHTRTLLKNGGLLVLGEVFQSSTFLEISFALSAGWWRWGDEHRRHNSPLLLPIEWDALLKQNGFLNTFSVGLTAHGTVFAVADNKL